MTGKSPVKFSKMHGLGNDFVVIETLSQSLDLTADQIRFLANRHMGVGFDQLLLIQPSEQAEFACRIFNADGSEAEQCGNGLRCVVKFLHDKNFTNKKSFSVATKAGVFAVTVKDSLIEVAMGLPCFTPEHIPFNTPHRENTYLLTVEGQDKPIEISALSMGNPHVIHRVDSVSTFPVRELGYKIMQHTAFPKGTNVGFMEIINKQHIRLRTVERGAGETFACGSNACAAVVAGIINHNLDSKVNVELAFGQLEIDWQGEQSAVKMTGPAVNVFDGLIYL